MPYWEVRTCLPCCSEEFFRFTAILLRGIAHALLLRGLASVVPAQFEHLFYNMESVP
jgi:hypothetical protein